MISNLQIRKLSQDMLAKKWKDAVLLALIYMLIYIIIYGILIALDDFLSPSSFEGSSINLSRVIVWAPMTLVLFPFLEFGIIQYFVHMSRKGPAAPKDLLAAVNTSVPPTSVIILDLVKRIFIGLWSLLLIIPGYVKRCSYAMAIYILRDNPSMGTLEALRESERMMRGYKWQYVCLILSFTGWFLLSVLTCGIGFLWFIPYFKLSIANFYVNLCVCEDRNFPYIFS